MQFSGEIYKVRSLSTLLSPSNISRLILNNDVSYYKKVVSKHLEYSGQKSLGDILKYVYGLQLKYYRNEYIHKNAIVNDILKSNLRLKSTRVLNEFRISSSIADLVMLNGEVRVFEVKTDLDSLDKLEKQISDYYKFSNQVYIVTEKRMAEKLISKYKDTSVGIIALSKYGKIKTVKQATTENQFLDHLTIFKTLRKQEYIKIVKDCTGAVPDVPNTRIYNECFNVCKAIEVTSFQELAVSEIKKREFKSPLGFISEKTPFELKHSCNSLNLSEKDYTNFHKLLDIKI